VLRDPPSLFAVQRLPTDRWLVRAPSEDPFEPAVRVIDAVEEPALAHHVTPRQQSRHPITRRRATMPPGRGKLASMS
jgi:hypothetical protein